MSFLESWIFSRNQNSPKARPVVSYCPHVRACNPNLHEFNQKGIKVLWWAAPPQHADQPPSNLWMASFWFPEAWDGECLRYLEMRKVSGHVMINWHPQPSSCVNRGRVCSSYLTFGCHSLHPNYGIRGKHWTFRILHQVGENWIGPDLPDRNKIPDPFNLNPI